MTFFLFPILTQAKLPCHSLLTPLSPSQLIDRVHIHIHCCPPSSTTTNSTRQWFSHLAPSDPVFSIPSHPVFSFWVVTIFSTPHLLCPGDYISPQLSTENQIVSQLSPSQLFIKHCRGWRSCELVPGLSINYFNPGDFPGMLTSASAFFFFFFHPSVRLRSPIALGSLHSRASVIVADCLLPLT